MISDLIVWTSVGLTLLFVGAWASSPVLRAWIERPKHRFVEAAQQYDAATAHDRAPSEPRTP